MTIHITENNAVSQSRCTCPHHVYGTAARETDTQYISGIEAHCGKLL